MDPVLQRLRDDLAARQIIDEHGLLPSQAALAQRYRVSRARMREVMSAVAAQGLIVISQGKRARALAGDPLPIARQLAAVLAQGDWSLAHVYQARIAIEQTTVTAAASQPDPALIDRLQREIDRLASATDDRTAIDADRSFHSAIAEASGNPLLTVLYRSLATSIENVQTRNLTQRDFRWVIRDHRRIVEAIAGGDVAAAQQAIIAHCEQSRRRLPVRGEAT